MMAGGTSKRKRDAKDENSDDGNKPDADNINEGNEESKDGSEEYEPPRARKRRMQTRASKVTTKSSYPELDDGGENVEGDGKDDGKRTSKNQTNRQKKRAKIEGVPGANDKPRGTIRRCDSTQQLETPDEDGTFVAAIYHNDIRGLLIDQANTGTYRHGRARGPRLFDETAFHPGQRTWGPERADWPDVLHQIELTNHPASNGNVPWMRVNGRIVVDHDDHPVRDFPELPLTLSAKAEWWLLEAIGRLNPDITTMDIRARMPALKGKEGCARPALQTPSAITNRTMRGRLSQGLLSWKARDGTKSVNDHLRARLPAEARRLNTTRNVPVEDLTIEEKTKVKEINKGKNPKRAGNNALSPEERKRREAAAAEKEKRDRKAEKTKTGKPSPATKTTDQSRPNTQANDIASVPQTLPNPGPTPYEMWPDHTQSQMPPAYGEYNTPPNPNADPPLNYNMNETSYGVYPELSPSPPSNQANYGYVVNNPAPATPMGTFQPASPYGVNNAAPSRHVYSFQPERPSRLGHPGPSLDPNAPTTTYRNDFTHQTNPYGPGGVYHDPNLDPALFQTQGVPMNQGGTSLTHASSDLDPNLPPVNYDQPQLQPTQRSRPSNRMRFPSRAQNQNDENSSTEDANSHRQRRSSRSHEKPSDPTASPANATRPSRKRKAQAESTEEDKTEAPDDEIQSKRRQLASGVPASAHRAIRNDGSDSEQPTLGHNESQIHSSSALGLPQAEDLVSNCSPVAPRAPEQDYPDAVDFRTVAPSNEAEQAQVHRALRQTRRDYSAWLGMAPEGNPRQESSYITRWWELQNAFTPQYRAMYPNGTEVPALSFLGAWADSFVNFQASDIVPCEAPRGTLYGQEVPGSTVNTQSPSIGQPQATAPLVQEAEPFQPALDTEPAHASGAITSSTERQPWQTTQNSQPPIGFGQQRNNDDQRGGSAPSIQADGASSTARTPPMHPPSTQISNDQDIAILANLVDGWTTEQIRNAPPQFLQWLHSLSPLEYPTLPTGILGRVPEILAAHPRPVRAPTQGSPSSS